MVVLVRGKKKQVVERWMGKVSTGTQAHAALLLFQISILMGRDLNSSSPLNFNEILPNSKDSRKAFTTIYIHTLSTGLPRWL